MTPDIVLSPIDSVTVDRQELFRYLGTTTFPPEMQAVIEEQIALGETLARPAFVYRLRPVAELRFSSNCLRDVLRRAEYAALIVCTIGPALEERAAELFAAKEYWRSVALDAVGSVLAEVLTDRLAQALRTALQPYKTSIRYSPGYGDWELTDQQTLFALLETAAVGVTLNSSCLMKPLKSVSFMSAIGQEIPDMYLTRRKCDVCPKQDCKFRNKSK